MTSFLKALAMKLPALRAHKKRVDALHEERDRLAWQLDHLNRQIANSHSGGDWTEEKDRKQKLSAEYRERASTSRLTYLVDPVNDHLSTPLKQWIQHQMASEPYWFQRIEVLPGVFSPG